MVLACIFFVDFYTSLYYFYLVLFTRGEASRQNQELAKLLILEEDVRPLHLLRSNLIMDRHVRRGDPASLMYTYGVSLSLRFMEMRGIP